MKNKEQRKPDHIELNRFFVEWTEKNVGDPGTMGLQQAVGLAQQQAFKKVARGE